MSKKIKKSSKVKKKMASHNKNVPSKTFSHNKPCICCGEKLIRISSTDRYLSNTEGRIRIFVEVKECQNQKCKAYQQKIKAPEFNNLIFPDISYGIDLVAEIGILRLKEHKTIFEIHEIIMRKYPHVEMTERHMLNIVNKIMYLLEESSLSPEIMKAKLLKSNNIKGLVLSVDGLQPEQGNEILYVVREIQTGEILLARFLKFSDEDTIKKEIYEPLKKLSEKMKLPVLGLIADKQLALTTAFEKVFPRTPIQHCQSHFLKALRKPIQEESSKMAKDIKKTSNQGDRKKN